MARVPSVARIAILCLAAVLLAMPAVGADSKVLIIARVDGKAVTGAAFAPYLRAYLRSKLYHSGSPERVRVLANEAIDAFLVDRVLARQAADRKLKIDKAEVDKRVAAIKARFGKRPDWPEIQARLPELRREIETDLRVGALKREISHVAPPSKAEVNSFYESRPDLFTRPAAYRLRFLLIAVDPGASPEAWRAAEKQAREYRRSATSGEDFARLARTHSKHSSSEKGGEIGLVHEGQLGEAAEAVLRPAAVGAVVGPVRLLQGIALFKVEEKRLAALMPFREVKERALSLMQRERAKEQWHDYVATIRKRFSVDRSAFETFVKSLPARNHK